MNSIKNLNYEEFKEVPNFVHVNLDEESLKMNELMADSILDVLLSDQSVHQK